VEPLVGEPRPVEPRLEGVGHVPRIESRPGLTREDEAVDPLDPLPTTMLPTVRMGRRHDQWVGTIVFNRALDDAIEVVGDHDLEFGMVSWPLERRSPR
jgi:hypothetical protein